LYFAAVTALMAGCASVGGAAAPKAADGGAVLFLSKSSGFEHSVIKWDDQKHNHVGNVLEPLTKGLGMTLESTKDASLINADNLKKYKLVIFYTTGDLTQSGSDKTPPMGPNGEAELLSWIQNGGAFIGFHCATDSFHTPQGGAVTPYVKMLGAEFKGHGAQFEGTVKVVDPKHPTMAGVPSPWRIKDEWYTFINLNKDSMHVLALLDPGDERAKQEMYNVPAYPMIWCSQLGKGRVYFNGMGHREDVWTDATFQKTLVDAIKWVCGEGPAMSEPNYSQVVSK
jgi:hypothetical protein